ncbi:MAG: phage tail protein [Thermoanaerobaculia bacterium]
MKQEQIAQLLPTVIRRTVDFSPPLAALLGVMESMHAPSERVLSTFSAVLNPFTAPDAFVPVLASWLGLEPILELRSDGTAGISAGTGRLRELVAAAARLGKWRGTTKGLLEILAVATGSREFVIEEGTRPFHFDLHIPAEATTHRDLIERIVAMEKPAYVTCTIDVTRPSREE